MAIDATPLTANEVPVLLRFQVTNHASLRDEQELSLIAADEHAGRAEPGVPGSAEHVVPVAAIYGANASGKSNVLDALVWMRHAVLSSFQRWDPEEGVPRRPFRLRPDVAAHPSTYEADFVTGDVRYTYGFTVDGERIRAEWLYYFHEGHRRKLFERPGAGGEAVKFSRYLTGQRKVISSLLRENSLFLSVAAAQGHKQLGEIYRWFRRALRVASDQDFGCRMDYTIDLYRREADEGGRRGVEALLKFADLGVEDLLIRDHDSKVEEEQQKVLAAVQEVVGERVVVDHHPRHQIQVAHRTGEGAFPLDLAEESSGTRSWIGLLGPTLTTLASGGVLCVDELDAQLHPQLVDALVGAFQSSEINERGAQLIFSTHAATLLGRTARTELYRDQVWFTEKSEETCATRLFPLTDFYVRKSGESLEKRYLAGRYGALPFLDDDLLKSLIGNVEPGGVRGAGQVSEAAEASSAGAA
jgi:AAA domain, putative AbiEii toxin, Type IV TA system